MKQIFTLAGCLLFLNGFSAIVHQNVNVTLTQNGTKFYYLDVNSDGTWDYELIFGLDYQTQANAFQIVGNSVTTNNGTQSDWADQNPETLGHSVGANASWAPNFDMFTYDTSNYTGGAFQHGQFYVGFSFLIGSTRYLGWIRVYTPNADSMIIYDCAYDNVSGDVPTVGETTTAIDQLSAGSINLHWFNGAIYVSGLNTDIADGLLTVHDLTGRTVLSQRMESSTQNVPFNTAAKGIYLVNLYLNNGEVVTRKIVMQ